MPAVKPPLVSCRLWCTTTPTPPLPCPFSALVTRPSPTYDPTLRAAAQGAAAHSPTCRPRRRGLRAAGADDECPAGRRSHRVGVCRFVRHFGLGYGFRLGYKGLCVVPIVVPPRSCAGSRNGSPFLLWFRCRVATPLSPLLPSSTAWDRYPPPTRRASGRAAADPAPLTHLAHCAAQHHAPGSLPVTEKRCKPVTPAPRPRHPDKKNLNREPGREQFFVSSKNQPSHRRFWGIGWRAGSATEMGGPEGGLGKGGKPGTPAQLRGQAFPGAKGGPQGSNADFWVFFRPPRGQSASPEVPLKVEKQWKTARGHPGNPSGGGKFGFLV